MKGIRAPLLFIICLIFLYACISGVTSSAESSPTVLEMLERLANEEGGGQYTTFSNILLQIPKLRNLLSGVEHFENANSFGEDLEKDESKKFQMILFMPTNVAVANRGQLESSIFKNAILYHIVSSKVSRKMLDSAAETGSPIILETALSAANSGSGTSFSVRLPLGVPQRLILNSPRSIPSELSEIIRLKPEHWSVQYGLLPEATILSSTGWECSNGLILPIDVFLLPPIDFVVTMASLHVNAFVQLLSSAGIGSDLPPGALIGKPGVTLFLPTQEALMEKIGLLQELDRKELHDLLKRHIIIGDDSLPVYLDGKIYDVRSSSGERLFIEPSMFPSSEAGIVNGQRILYGNVLLSNGVAHIIDGVIPETTPFLEKYPQEKNGKGQDPDKGVTSQTSDFTDSQGNALPAVWTGSSAFLFAAALLAVMFIM
ncbi:hypothetical protein DI09_6p530 [Mitosporidium daphniae]|uniref:FAS1 domain-containing protein n=1 Tax=Mitosporidium daphniae TaxID=1485682 RepID=A0A098VNV5_9MICR|nr:uncharacterized protein DI09_6p530 [Mitosporidium daphniae]KGG50469.1 hypothetical protein DI09_6p530 [Mitosporidium daphniae]|eukprot:XP_013236896.1 uncharacterized protein DI09_6p530 [Mitosporidium daphniae]